RAARRATRVYATDEAMLHLKHAREAAEGLEDRAHLLDIDIQIGELCSIRGEYPQGIQALERALSMQPDARQAAVIHGEIGNLYTQMSDARGLQHLEIALAGLDPVTQAGRRAEALSRVGRFHHYQAEHRKSIEYYEQARAIAEPLEDVEALTWIYGYFAGAYQHLSRYQDSMGWARRAIVVGERKQNPFALSLGNEFMAEDLTVVSRFDEAMDYVRRNVEMARRMGSLDRLAWTTVPRCSVLHCTGALSEALEECDLGIELTE